MVIIFFSVSLISDDKFKLYMLINNTSEENEQQLINKRLIL